MRRMQSTAESSGKPRIAVVRAEDGSVGWQARDEYGTLIRPKFGKIYGIDEFAREGEPQYELSRRIIERVLLELGRRTRGDALHLAAGAKAAKRAAQVIKHRGGKQRRAGRRSVGKTGYRTVALDDPIVEA